MLVLTPENGDDNSRFARLSGLSPGTQSDGSKSEGLETFNLPREWDSGVQERALGCLGSGGWLGRMAAASFWGSDSLLRHGVREVTGVTSLLFCGDEDVEAGMRRTLGPDHVAGSSRGGLRRPVPPPASPACPWSRLTVGEARRHCVDGAHTSAGEHGAVVWGARCQPFPRAPACRASLRRAGAVLLSAAAAPQTGSETRLVAAHSCPHRRSQATSQLFLSRPACRGALSSPGPLLKSLGSHSISRRRCSAAQPQPQLPGAGDAGRQLAESRGSGGRPGAHGPLCSSPLGRSI